MQINTSTVALVTGGASGLGEATTRRLHEDGSAVVIVDLPSSGGQALAAELGSRVRFCAADVRDEAQVQAAIAAAQELGTCGSSSAARVSARRAGSSAARAHSTSRPSETSLTSTWLGPSTSCAWPPRPCSPTSRLTATAESS